MADTLDMTPRDGSRWRHKKRGSTYSVMGVASAQVVGDPIEEGAMAVVYRSEHDGSLWLRPAAEFMDGRFEPLTEATPRADDMPEMVPPASVRAQILPNVGGDARRLYALVINTAFRDGVLAARSRTAEPSDMSDYAKFVFGGGSYTPVAGLGKYAGVHQLTVRAVLAEAKELYPRGADVIAALVWHRTLDYVQREHAITAAREAAVRECAEEIEAWAKASDGCANWGGDISGSPFLRNLVIPRILSLLKTGETPLDRRPGFDAGYGTIKEGDTALYMGEPCKVLTVFPDGDVQIEVTKYLTVKWRRVMPNAPETTDGK